MKFRSTLAIGSSLALVWGIATACSSSSSSPPPDNDGGDYDAGQAVLPDASVSFCGHPGDKGNSFGVGSFCQQLTDCSENSRAKVCAILGDDQSFFCTLVCDKDGSADQCGENAHCANQGGPSGCIPDICDPPHDAGTDANIADADDAG